MFSKLYYMYVHICITTVKVSETMIYKCMYLFISTHVELISNNVAT